MGNFIYFGCGLGTMLWAGWLFFLWEKRAGLNDTSLWRFILVLLPVTIFILLVFNDWSRFIFLRLDLVALAGIFAINLVSWLVQVGSLLVIPAAFRKVFLVSGVTNILLNLGILASTYLMKANPLLAVRLSTFLESWRRFDLVKVLWEGLDPERNEQTVYNLVNKILIALAIYIPMTAVRIWYTNRKFKQLKGEIKRLEAGLEELRETRPDVSDPGRPERWL